MSQRRKVEILYRDRRIVGEWSIAEDGQVCVTSPLGRKSASVRGGMPSEIAEALLFELARKADPKRPFFFF